MPLVAIESPWSGMPGGLGRAELYLRNCIRDCLHRQEVPWASHAMLALTHALYEDDLEQRYEGLEVNHTMIQNYVDYVALYVDHGISRGMLQAEAWAREAGKRVERRYIFKVRVTLEQVQKARSNG